MKKKDVETAEEVDKNVVSMNEEMSAKKGVVIATKSKGAAKNRKAVKIALASCMGAGVISLFGFGFGGIAACIDATREIERIANKYNYEMHNMEFRYQQMKSLNKQFENGEISESELKKEIGKIEDLDKYKFVVGNEDVSEEDLKACQRAHKQDEIGGRVAIVGGSCVGGGLTAAALVASAINDAVEEKRQKAQDSQAEPTIQ